MVVRAVLLAFPVGPRIFIEVRRQQRGLRNAQETSLTRQTGLRPVKATPPLLLVLVPRSHGTSAARLGRGKVARSLRFARMGTVRSRTAEWKYDTRNGRTTRFCLVTERDPPYRDPRWTPLSGASEAEN